MNTSNRQTGRAALLPILGAVAMILTIGLTGCSTMPSVQSAHDSTVDFSHYKRFVVLSLFGGPRVSPGAALNLAQTAEQAAREALTAKGMTETARDKADFAVNLRGESLPRVEVTDWGYSRYPVGVGRRGWVYYGGYHEVDVRTTEDRKLVVEIYDNASHKQVWVGSMERSGVVGTVQPQMVHDAVLKVLQGFPPAPKAP